MMLTFTRSDEHDGAVTAADSFSAEKLFVTGGEDGFVKIWTYQKLLIREIKFPESISCVCFMNDKCDVLVGHGDKISILKAEDYYPH